MSSTAWLSAFCLQMLVFLFAFRPQEAGTECRENSALGCWLLDARSSENMTENVSPLDLGIPSLNTPPKVEGRHYGVMDRGLEAQGSVPQQREACAS